MYLKVAALQPLIPLLAHLAVVAVSRGQAWVGVLTFLSGDSDYLHGLNII